MDDAARLESDDARARGVPAHPDRAREVEQRARFLAVAQHKLKTPLAVIAGWSDTLRTADRLGPDERRAGLDAIRRAAADLEGQIEDLLDEARMHLLAQSLDPVPVALDEWVVAEIADLHLDPDRHPVDVRIPPGTVVLADPEALHRVVAHLIDNAVTYSPDGGTVEIAADVTPDGVVVRVADHGLGLPDDGTDLFEPFRRGPRSARVARGSGLGLHIVRSFVERMGGEVSAHNGPHGAVVEITLPSG